MDVNQTLAHLGGLRALQVMTGAHSFTHDRQGRSLTFKFKGSRRANAARVVLAGDDTYTLTVYKVGVPLKVVAEETGLYAEDLQGRFEAITGLVLTVPRVQGVNA